MFRDKNTTPKKIGGPKPLLQRYPPQVGPADSESENSDSESGDFDNESEVNNINANANTEVDVLKTNGSDNSCLSSSSRNYEPMVHIYYSLLGQGSMKQSIYLNSTKSLNLNLTFLLLNHIVVGPKL